MLTLFTHSILATTFIIMSAPAAAVAPSQDVASKSALAVSPAILETVLTPGEPSGFSVEVRNITDFPLPIKSFVRNLTAESHTTDLSADEQARLDASKWFNVKDPDFILQPKQSRTVTGTVQTPMSADPGGHYATIFFQPLVPAEALSPATTYINARVGILAFLVVKGDEVQKLELKKGITTDTLVQEGPINFAFSLHNSGNTHLLPHGKIAIYDMFGKHVADIDTPAGVVLPGTTREYSVAWDGPPLPGNYRVDLLITYGPDTAALPKTSVSFWVIPWTGLIVGTVSLGVIILFIFKTKHRWYRAWNALGSTIK